MSTSHKSAFPFFRKRPSAASPAWLSRLLDITKAAQDAPFPYVKDGAGNLLELLDIVNQDLQKSAKNNADLILTYRDVLESAVDVINLVGAAHDEITASPCKMVCMELNKFIRSIVEMSNERKDEMWTLQYLNSPSARETIDEYRKQINHNRANFKFAIGTIQTQSQSASIAKVQFKATFALVGGKIASFTTGMDAFVPAFSGGLIWLTYMDIQDLKGLCICRGSLGAAKIDMMFDSGVTIIGPIEGGPAQAKHIAAVGIWTVE